MQTNSKVSPVQTPQPVLPKEPKIPSRLFMVCGYLLSLAAFYAIFMGLAARIPSFASLLEPKTLTIAESILQQFWLFVLILAAGLLLMLIPSLRSKKYYNAIAEIQKKLPMNPNSAWDKKMAAEREKQAKLGKALRWVGRGTLASSFLLLILAVVFHPIFLFYALVMLLIWCMQWWQGSLSLKRKEGIYKEDYLRLLVMPQLRSVFQDVKLQPKRYLKYDDIRHVSLVAGASQYSGNNLLTGKYHGLAFAQADMTLDSSVVIKDNPTNLFIGRWITIPSPRPLRGEVYVWSNGFRSKAVAEAEQNGCEKVLLEDEGFNQMFTVYAKDALEAFSSLTPAILENLRLLVHGQQNRPAYPNVALCFYQTEVHLLVDNLTNAFEPPAGFSFLNEEQSLQKICAEIAVTTTMIDNIYS